MAREVASMSEIVREANRIVADIESATEKERRYRGNSNIEHFYNKVLFSEILMNLQGKSLGEKEIVNVLTDLGKALQENISLHSNSNQEPKQSGLLARLAPVLANFAESDDYVYLERIRKSSTDLPFASGKVPLEKVLEGTTFEYTRGLFEDYKPLPALERLAGLSEKLGGCTDALVIRHLITPPLFLKDFLNDRLTLEEGRKSLETLKSINCNQEDKGIFSGIKTALELANNHKEHLLAVLTSKETYSLTNEIKNADVLFGSNKFVKPGVRHFELVKVIKADTERKMDIDHKAPKSAIERSNIFSK